MNLARLCRHALIPGWVARRGFTPGVLAAIENAIRESEQSHRGELRFVAEGDLHPLAVARGLTPRGRARQLFGSLGVWDTAQNSGVLIYVQCVDRAIEIVADRGIAAKVPQAEWDAICRRMEAAFRRGEFEAGAVAGIRDITTLLARHFPPGPSNPDELPDKPVLI
jgi:hypothetical protein